MRNRLSLTCEVVPEEKKMPRKPNEIAVKWLESKDVGKTHRVNVKHVVGQLADIAVGAEVSVRFNAKRYRGTVTDLLDWAPPKKKRKPSQSTKEKENEKKKKKSAKVSEVHSYLSLCIEKIATEYHH